MADRSRLLCGSAAGFSLFAWTWREARRPGIAPADERILRAVNGLPDEIHPPVWAVMQAGSLAGVGVAAGLAALRGKAGLALGLAVAGSTMWAGCKEVKHLIGRGRPAQHLDGVRIRGREQSGLGFPSGHSAVAASLATVAAGSGIRAGPLALGAATVGLARVYTGAHFPLDVAGGWAVGVAAGLLTRLVMLSGLPAGAAPSPSRAARSRTPHRSPGR